MPWTIYRTCIKRLGKVALLVIKALGALDVNSWRFYGRMG